MLDILSRLCVGLFSKRIRRDLLNKYHAVMQRIVYNEELMACMGSDLVIYVHSKKDFEFLERKKCMEINNLCTGNIYCISANKVNTTRFSFVK